MTTVALSGISVVMIQPAPILTLLPMMIPPIILAAVPIMTLSPMIGALPFFHRLFLRTEIRFDLTGQKPWDEHEWIFIQFPSRLNV